MNKYIKPPSQEIFSDYWTHALLLLLTKCCVSSTAFVLVSPSVRKERERGRDFYFHLRIVHMKVRKTTKDLIWKCFSVTAKTSYKDNTSSAIFYLRFSATDILVLSNKLIFSKLRKKEDQIKIGRWRWTDPSLGRRPFCVKLHPSTSWERQATPDNRRTGRGILLVKFW